MLALFAVFLILLVSAPQNASLLLAFFISSVFPDLDSKNSTVRKTASIIMPAILSFFVVFNSNSDLQTGVFAGLVALFASHLLINNLPLSHRGKNSLHRKSPMLLFSLFIGVLVWLMFRNSDLWQIISASLLGYAVHMATDRLFNRT